MGTVETLTAGKPAYGAPRPINEDDAVEDFACGKAPLDDFLTKRAWKNEGRSSRTYVVCAANGEVAAYYSLAAGAVSHDNAPGWAKRNMPDPLPVIVLGRLAVHEKHQGKGLGKGLLREAIQRTLDASTNIGARALIVHAVDDEAIGYYTAYGFRRFPTDGRTLFLPTETLSAALG